MKVAIPPLGAALPVIALCATAMSCVASSSLRSEKAFDDDADSSTGVAPDDSAVGPSDGDGDVRDAAGPEDDEEAAALDASDERETAPDGSPVQVECKATGGTCEPSALCCDATIGYRYVESADCQQEAPGLVLCSGLREGPGIPCASSPSSACFVRNASPSEVYYFPSGPATLAGYSPCDAELSLKVSGAPRKADCVP